MYGSKNALLDTAFVPLMLAIGFMLLIAYFYFTGGYKQVHLEGEKPNRPTGGASRGGRGIPIVPLCRLPACR